MTRFVCQFIFLRRPKRSQGPERGSYSDAGGQKRPAARSVAHSRAGRSALRAERLGTCAATRADAQSHACSRSKAWCRRRVCSQDSYCVRRNARPHELDNFWAGRAGCSRLTRMVFHGRRNRSAPPPVPSFFSELKNWQIFLEHEQKKRCRSAYGRKGAQAGRRDIAQFRFFPR